MRRMQDIFLASTFKKHNTDDEELLDQNILAKMKFIVALFASLVIAAPAPAPTDYEVVVVPHGNPVEIDVPGYAINVNK
ncbi:hypothetical protein NLG97_g6463 [Lecanicillium saksenae]|uniref:Uncharacterized protein n=1 Tax=Lecanicillium saksenae TaxID=468837 RepID=A0ACC1QQ53_9HYPO|nr:hypothetical protein NLG97_g6463 [Lecanicillium saksenae]